ncbi:4-hydroxy-3-polyprenylbenzoate decarboxylase [Thermoflavifilum aggregans]|uniref:4-hydroxy-3-polyprenylbenzoate decarboxylase n=1 Tax=Thermoflavifilum aggregans TaxID=454188 RepID=A0A2M9CVJ4_9BACT|nr:menaquinone biosynthesis decarboxylase [Thermoflavifilum aggregans]PJJ75914.1 4-hydroxy-3-polyprenylbenzoate decarboxylase [Thermoflavifilum aggregans]
MAYRSLRAFVERLEQAHELVRIQAYVNPRLEIAEITDRMCKSPGGGKALLFENTGYDFPVLINAMGSYRRMCLALGVDNLDDIGREMESLFKELALPKGSLLEKLTLLPTLGKLASWMPVSIKGRGACQEVIMEEPDLYRLPILTCWPKDGGPFITLPIIHTKDPDTGIRNVGMYRMQVFTKDMTGMHWHKHKVSARHYQAYKAKGLKMPVAVALGGDPVYTYAATAPLPDNVDEYMLAGFIRKKRVELVKCLTQDIEVPADADIVIEGYVDPTEDPIWEGPFGDHTGYYSLPDWYPRFHVTCITHRKNAIYPATIVGIPPQEDAWIGKATERIFITPIKMTLLPEVEDMDMPIEGVFHNLTIVKIRKQYPGHAQKVMNAMWGAGQMMFNKMLIIVDEDVNIHDYETLARYAFAHIRPELDIYFSQGPMDVLDHACSKPGIGGKMCIDATRKWEEEMDTETHETYKPDALPGLHELQQRFPEIRDVNVSLLHRQIPCVLIAVRKNRKGHIAELHAACAQIFAQAGVKMILYAEHTVNVQDLAVALWRITNNLDPRRDHHMATGIIGLDGTIKTREFDGFQRDWPNIIVSDLQTIQAVDAKWDSLGIGPFIPSPSLRFRDQLYGEEAVAHPS